MELEGALVLEGEAQAFHQRVHLQFFCRIGGHVLASGADGVGFELIPFQPVCHAGVGVVVDESDAQQLSAAGGQDGHLVGVRH